MGLSSLAPFLDAPEARKVSTILSPKRFRFSLSTKCKSPFHQISYGWPEQVFRAHTEFHSSLDSDLVHLLSTFYSPLNFVGVSTADKNDDALRLDFYFHSLVRCIFRIMTLAKLEKLENDMRGKIQVSHCDGLDFWGRTR